MDKATSARRLKSARSVRRRQQLLDAARDVFEELGYFDTTVAHIARRAKAAHGTFYTYFDSRDAILEVLVRDLADQLYEAAAADLDQSLSGFSALEASIRQFMAAYREHAPLLRILDQATLASDTYLHIRLGIRQRFSARLEALLSERMTKTPDPDGLDPAAAAAALGGMVEDFARGRYILGIESDDEAAIRTLAVLWARGVGVAIE